MIRLGWRTMYGGLFTMEVNGVPVYRSITISISVDSLYIDYSFDIERFSFFSAVMKRWVSRWDSSRHTSFERLAGDDPCSSELTIKAITIIHGRCLMTLHNLKHPGIHGREVVQDLLDLPIPT